MRVPCDHILWFRRSLFGYCGEDVLKVGKSEGGDPLRQVILTSCREVMEAEEAERNGQIQES